jgi:hypothetical protein
MKKLVQVQEVEDAGLIALMGKTITLLCMNYFYTGTLTGVNDKFVQLTDPKIVYDTGNWSDKTWADAQKLPCKEVYVMLSAVEAFGELK